MPKTADCKARGARLTASDTGVTEQAPLLPDLDRIRDDFEGFTDDLEADEACNRQQLERSIPNWSWILASLSIVALFVCGTLLLVSVSANKLLDEGID